MTARLLACLLCRARATELASSLLLPRRRAWRARTSVVWLHATLTRRWRVMVTTTSTLAAMTAGLGTQTRLRLGCAACSRPVVATQRAGWTTAECRQRDKCYSLAATLFEQLTTFACRRPRSCRLSSAPLLTPSTWTGRAWAFAMVASNCVVCHHPVCRVGQAAACAA
jgi:hypothetical protein